MLGTMNGREVGNGSYAVKVGIGFNRFETGIILGFSEYRSV
jgi:hypothetical protein